MLDALLNHAIQTGRINALYRGNGCAPALLDRGEVLETRALVNCFDLFDPVQSRNLLAHLRRLAERTMWRLPALHALVHPKDPINDPGGRLVYTNAAYLTALHDHMQHHFDAAPLAEHYPAVGCAPPYWRR
ncbi:MAG: hypothetical protein R2911_17870 [Caldilineaceae bacterium]